MFLAVTTANENESNIEHLMPVRVDGNTVESILDGGASCNLINGATLSLESRKRVRPTDFYIRTSKGSLFKPIGEIHGLGVETAGGCVRISALVVEKTGYDLLLGRPFLKQNSAKTDWLEDRYEFIIAGQQAVINCSKVA